MSQMDLEKAVAATRNAKIPTYVAGGSTYWSPHVDSDDNQVELFFALCLQFIHSSIFVISQ